MNARSLGGRFREDEHTHFFSGFSFSNTPTDSKGGRVDEVSREGSLAVVQ